MQVSDLLLLIVIGLSVGLVGGNLGVGGDFFCSLVSVKLPAKTLKNNN